MLFAGLVVAAFIALSQVNLETLRGDLISVMSKAVGLPIEIDGAISWKFSLRPQVVLEQVKIPNAPWANHKNGFYAERISAKLDLLSLLYGKTEINSLKIYDLDIFLEENEKGEQSLAIAKPDDSSEQKAESRFPFDVDIGLDSLELHNVNALIGHTQHYISGMRLEYSDKGDSLEYSGWLRGESKVYPFIISFSEFNTERKIYPVRVALSTGGNALVANIALEGTSRIPIDFKISGTVAEVKELGQIFGLDLPKMPELEINLAGGLAKHKLTLRKSSVSARGTTADISGSFDWSGKVPNIAAKISAKKISLMTVFPELYESKWVMPTDRPLNIFKDVPLFGKEFHKYNFDLDLSIGELLVYRELALKNINAKITLRNSILRGDATVKFAGGDVKAALDADADDKGNLFVQAAGAGNNVFIGKIMEAVRESDYISDLPVNFQFYVRGHGADLSELMGSATGPLELYSADTGYAHSELVSYIYGGDFLTDLRHSVTDLFRSKKMGEQLTIKCAAVNLKLRGGKIETAKGLAVETNAVNLRFVGHTDLETENMKVAMITTPVRGLKLSLTGNVVNNIEFVGNMADPDLKINGDALIAKAASATGIGLLLVPFTGGLSLVAGAGVGLLAGDLIENWLADDHPCETAMQSGAPAVKGDPDFLNVPIADLIGGMMK
jgi:hypothetical protein